MFTLQNKLQAPSGSPSAKSVKIKLMPPQTPEIPHRQLPSFEFNQVKTRVEKSTRIRQDLKPANNQPFNQQRLQEVRQVEKMTAFDSPGLHETLLDTRGFQEQRYKINYKSPNGQVITEELIFFIRPGKNGEWEFLKDDSGKSIALNSNLYESRLTSTIHPQGVDYNTYTIPKIDGRGSYTGVVTLITPKSRNLTSTNIPQSLHPEAAQQAKIAEAKTKTEPILDKLKTNFPGRGVNGAGRLGIEVSLTNQELIILQETIKTLNQTIESSAEIQKTLALVKQLRGTKSFDILHGFGRSVVEDNNTQSPKVETTTAGPVIKVSPETYQLWRKFSNLNSASTIVNWCLNQEKPLNSTSGNLAYGTLASTLARYIESGFK